MSKYKNKAIVIRKLSDEEVVKRKRGSNNVRKGVILLCHDGRRR